MKRIAIITNMPAPYRVALYSLLQNDERYKDYEFHVIFSARSESQRDWSVDLACIKNYYFLGAKTIEGRSRYDKTQLIISKGVAETLKKIKPDVVIASEYNTTALQAFVYCKTRKIPYISMTDGTLFSERNFSKIKKLLRYVVIKGANLCIASSTKSMELQLNYGAKRENIVIAYLTVDIDKYDYKREEYGDENILYVGSLIYRKGLDLLIEALPLVKHQFKLTIVGNGWEKEALVKRLAELSLSDKVVFKDFLEGEALLSEYKNNDIFVLPTREDCFGLVINEAMAQSMPVISSKYADGAYDLIDNSKNGYIVDPYNKEELAEAINKLVGNKALVKEMGEQSYVKIKDFSLKNTADRYIEAVNRVVN